MEPSNYIEESAITLPVIKNGVTRIGDLWDCNRSIIVGENLFGENLDGEYVNASPIEHLEYKLIHVKSTSEEVKTLKVGGEISLELLSGMITVKGAADFKSDEKKSSKIEKLICHYERETYTVFAQRNAKKLINEEIKKMLMNKEIKATHFVRAVTLGAEVRADIQFSHSDKSSFTDVSGNFFAKLTYGPINASLKADLQFLDSKKDENLNLEINVNSKPAMNKEPKTIDEMFKMIENITSVVQKEQHFPKLGGKVFGVPIRFLLVPITRFIEFDIERLYLKMTDKIMDDFKEMLEKIHDYQVPDCISKLVLNQFPDLVLFLNDERSKLSIEIREYENKLKIHCVEYFEKSLNVLKNYKFGKCTSEDLLKLRNKFENKCNSSEIQRKIMNFTADGEKQLRSVRYVDIQDSKQYVEILTNENKLKNFLRGDKESRILLYTDFEPPKGIFLKFYEMAKPLNDLKCKFAVAVQEISEEFKLLVKVQGIEEKYKKKEIPYILKIIGATVGIGFENERLFHSFNAELLNTSIPFETHEELTDINNLIKNSKIKMADNLTIANSNLETISLLTANDNRLKFFLPINMIQTSFQAFRALPVLMDKITSEIIDWVVGSLNVEAEGEAGFLYIIQNSKIIGICLDNYDLNLLRDNFKEIDFSTLNFLSPQNMENSFYPERVKNSIIIMKTIESYEYKFIKFSSFGLGSFKDTDDTTNIENILKALRLITTLRSKSKLQFIGVLANYALEENEKLKKCLDKAGLSTTEWIFHQNVLLDNTRKELIHAAQEIMENSNPFLVKLNMSLEIVRKLCIVKMNTQAESSQLIYALENLKNDKNCGETLRNQIISYLNDEIDFNTKCIQVKKLLENYEFKEGKENFHLKNFLSILENETDLNIRSVVLSYLSLINLDQNIYGLMKETLEKELKKKHYFRLIVNLTKIIHGTKYFILYKGLEELFGFDDKVLALERLLAQLSNEKLFNEDNWKDLWRNNRFLIIIKSMINKQPIQSILLKKFDSKIPDYVPTEIRLKIQKSFDSSKIVISDNIKNFDEFHKDLKELKSSEMIPEKFPINLARSVSNVNNVELRSQLARSSILKLLKWNGDKFHEPFEISSIEIILDKANQWTKSVAELKEEQIQFPRKCLDIFGEKSSIVKPRDYFLLRKILPRPTLSEKSSKPIFQNVFPYLIQNIKMIGCNVLTTENISLFIRPRRFNGQDEYSEQFVKNSNTIPLSRLDVIVGLLNNVSPTVGEEILNKMSMIPLALPLVIKRLYEKEIYNVLIPWLSKISIKWELQCGKLVVNNLFSDKFKMILALRIGNASPGNCGKSTALNQLFYQKDLFSSYCEKGGKNNKPVTLKGTAEMIYLTQQTVTSSLWDSCLSDHYANEENEVVILVNLHGNAIELPDHLDFFKNLASAYLLFVMSDNIEDLNSEFEKVEEMLCLESKSDKLFHIAIDPIEPNEFEEDLIFETPKLYQDSNMEKIRKVLKECLKQKSQNFKIDSIGNNSLVLTELINTNDSSDLITFFKNNTCSLVKKIMSLPSLIETQSDSVLNCRHVRKNNEQFNQLIQMFEKILNLEIDLRVKAFSHLEFELGKLNLNESDDIRKEIIYAQKEYHKLIELRNKGNEKISLNELHQCRIRMREGFKNLDEISLGLEHFFRIFRKLFESSVNDEESQKSNPYSIMAMRYAELLIQGQAIELFNGDSNSHHGLWLTEIFQNVKGILYPNMKIFVISIIGFQSTEKSTILDALFGCKASFSVRKGLFLRLLFLDKDLKQNSKFDVDAILLIETEGLDLPETHDILNHEKNHLMVSFSLSVSQLAIIFGEDLNNLSKIMKMSIDSISRFEKLNFFPDILMVQQMTVNACNEKLKNAREHLTNVIISSVKKVNDENRLFKSLKLKNTSYHQIRALKCGINELSTGEYEEDVVALYKIILEAARSRETTLDFTKWSELIQTRWDFLKKENEEINIKPRDVEKFLTVLQISDQINSLEEAIKLAFNKHSVNMIPLINKTGNNIGELKMGREEIIQEIRSILNSIPNECRSELQCKFCSNVLILQNEFYESLKGNSEELDMISKIEEHIKKTRELFIKHLIIWYGLEEDANQKSKEINLFKQIEEEIKSVYKEGDYFFNEIRNRKVATLMGIKAFENNFLFKSYSGEHVLKTPEYLIYSQTYELEGELKLLAQRILEEEKSETFQEGMVKIMKDKINAVLDKLGKERNTKVLETFKWKLIIFSIQNFIQHMKKQSEKWNREKNQLNVLLKNKEKYFNCISN